ncbi:MAG: hypothetical protein EAZ43_06845 [Betaproteobacteria bacterium]|nr:MAG: hypothetical protein EAZ43_06845 [Betaproteobacteria bacterium]
MALFLCANFLAQTTAQIVALNGGGLLFGAPRARPDGGVALVRPHRTRFERSGHVSYNFLANGIDDSKFHLPRLLRSLLRH